MAHIACMRKTTQVRKWSYKTFLRARCIFLIRVVLKIETTIYQREDKRYLRNIFDLRKAEVQVKCLFYFELW